MNLSFAALYGLSALSLFGLAILTGYLYEHGRSAWRRWRVRREMRHFPAANLSHKFINVGSVPATPKPFVQGMTLGPGESAYIEIPLTHLTRDQLENLATARDKAERKIQ